jgi:hypothetical protein
MLIFKWEAGEPVTQAGAIKKYVRFSLMPEHGEHVFAGGRGKRRRRHVPPGRKSQAGQSEVAAFSRDINREGCFIASEMPLFIHCD